MASKEQTHRNDNASSTRKLSEPATRNPDLPARQQNQPATLIQRAMHKPELLTPSDVLQLQRMVGNQATRKVLANVPHPATLVHPQRQATLSPRVMEDEGKTEPGTTQGQAVNWCEAQTGTLEPGQINEWGEMDGTLTSDVKPHVFVNGGKTGSGIVKWVAGGDGGGGNQSVGDITLVAPQYDSEDAADAGAEHATAWAWVRPATGTATVTRSYRGVLVGANSNAYYFTAAAAARADVHEELHVASSQSVHDTHIVPLEKRIAQYTGRANALRQGTTPAQAIAALQAIINWNATITAFGNADTAANTPMGTVDTADLASPTFIRNLGPRAVGGVNYANYIDTPP
jgi:hypothetical protein